MARTVNVGGGVADTAGIKGHDVVMPDIGLVHARLDIRPIAELVGDSRAARTSGVEEDGAAVGRVVGWHDGRELDNGNGDGAAVICAVVPSVSTSAHSMVG
jgi:hypothetical protein